MRIAVLCAFAAVLALGGCVEAIETIGVNPDSSGWRLQQVPTADDMRQVYPHDAMVRGINGHVVLNCVFDAAGGFTNCFVVSETPPGMGFGEAAIRVAPRFRAVPPVPGMKLAGNHAYLPMAFKVD